MRSADVIARYHPTQGHGMVEAISPLTMSVNDLHAEVTRAIRLPYVSLRVVAMGSRRPPPQDMSLSAHKMWGTVRRVLVGHAWIV